MSDMSNWTTQHRQIRTDVLTVTGLSTDTVKSMVSCQYINSAFSLDVKKEFMVTYAVTEDFPAVTMYSGDSANLTCGYEGRDKAQIEWYYERYAGTYSLISSESNNKYQQLTSFSNDTYHAKYIWKSSMNFAGMGFKCVIDFGDYKLEKVTRISRKEFDIAPLANTVVAPSDIMLTCAWGSSDKPATVTWLINGNENPFAIADTTTQGYLMTSKWVVSVDSTNFNTSYECVFMDEAGYKASSFTRVYGATVEIPQGEDFAPSPTNNKVECNFQSVLTAESLDWVLDDQVVNDTESQHVFKQDTTHISLTAVSIEPSNDGLYYCKATVLGNTLWDKIQITHSEVAIAGASVRYAVGVGSEVLECSAASRDYVYYIWWLVNGVRSSKVYNEQEDSQYLEYEKNSTLTAKPYLDAVRSSTGVLTYTCYAMTKYGSFQDSVEIHVRASEIKPAPLLALSSTWEITCSIVTDIIPDALYWMKDGVELHKNDAFSLQDSITGTDVKYEFKQEGNSFILNATDSSAADSGTYTCKFEYDDGPGTAATSDVTVRTVTSSVPRLYIEKEGVVELDCSLESTVEPKSVLWYRFSSTIKANDAKQAVTTEGNVTKTTLTFDNATVANFGFYTCRFVFDDEANPELVTNLQFADLTIKSPSSINLQSGHTLRLTASFYSSHMATYRLMWFRNGEVVLPSQGYTIWIKYVSWHKYDAYLAKTDIRSANAGEFTLELSTTTYPIHINSTAVTVGVIGASSETSTIYSTGGGQTIECKYQGSIVPSKVEWFYNGAAIDQATWTISTSDYADGALDTTITADSLTYSDSGDYTCSFQAGANSVNSETELKVRTIETSTVGKLYVTGDAMKVNVTVSSTDKPYMITAYVGEFKMYLTIKTVAVSNTEIRFETSFSYTARRAGSYDGDYVYKVSYKAGPELHSAPLSVIVRKAYTTEREAINKLSTASQSIMFTKTCIYNGVDVPSEVQWYLDGVLVEEDGLHTLAYKKTEDQRSSLLSKYIEVESRLQVNKATWQDGGVYECKFTSEDGNDPTVELPEVTILENSGLDDCYTSLDGTFASTCVFKSKVPLKEVKWTRYTTDIDGASSTDFSNNAISVALSLTDRTYKDDGKYYCKAETNSGYKVETVSYVKFASLTLRVTGGNDGKYYMGSKVIIYCSSVTELSGQKMFKDGEDTGKAKYYMFYVSDTTAGNYTCTGVLKNSCEDKEVIGTTAEGATTIVISPTMPAIIKNPADISTESGETVTFTCVTEYISGIATKITWNAENPYKYKYSKRTITSSSRGTITSLFMLKEVDASYAGEYYCSVYYGQTVIRSASATLNIAAFVTQPTETIAVINSDTQLSCAYSGQDQVILELLKGGEVSSIAVEMAYEDKDAATVSTGVFKFSNVGTDDAGVYQCQVKGLGIVSEEAELHLIEFGTQPADTLGVVKGNAQFNAYVTYYNWPGMTVLWQKEVDGAWLNATENWYVVRNPSWSEMDGKAWWRLQIDIRGLKTTDLTNWRVKVVYPDTDKLKGGSQTSDPAQLIPAGLTDLTITSADKFVGTDVTFRCEATTNTDPGKFSWYMNGAYLQVSYTMEQGDKTYTAVAVLPMNKYMSGKNLTCKATINYVRLEKTVTMYYAYMTCPALRDRTYGTIEYTVLSDTQQQANLTCSGENIYAKDDDKTLVTCDYTTGEWDKEMTSCWKVIKKDPREWRIMVYYKGFNYCNNDAQVEEVHKMLTKLKDKTCGFASENLNVLCYWAGTCDFLWKKTECLNRNGDLYIYGYFYWTGELDKTAGSDMMIAKADVASKSLTSTNFQCTTDWETGEFEEHMYGEASNTQKRSARHARSLKLPHNSNSVMLPPEDRPEEMFSYHDPNDDNLNLDASSAATSSATTSSTEATTEAASTTATEASSSTTEQGSLESVYINNVEPVETENQDPEDEGPDAESANINGLIWGAQDSEAQHDSDGGTGFIPEPAPYDYLVDSQHNMHEDKVIESDQIIVEDDRTIVEPQTVSEYNDSTMNDVLVAPASDQRTRPSNSVSESPTSTVEEEENDERKVISRLSFKELHHSDRMLHKLLISGVVLVTVLGVLCVVKLFGCRLFRRRDNRGDYERVVVISD